VPLCTLPFFHPKSPRNDSFEPGAVRIGLDVEADKLDGNRIDVDVFHDELDAFHIDLDGFPAKFAGSTSTSMRSASTSMWATQTLRGTHRP